MIEIYWIVKENITKNINIEYKMAIEFKDFCEKNKWRTISIQRFFIKWIGSITKREHM